MNSLLQPTLPFFNGMPSSKALGPSMPFPSSHRIAASDPRVSKEGLFFKDASLMAKVNSKMKGNKNSKGYQAHRKAEENDLVRKLLNQIELLQKENNGLRRESARRRKESEVALMKNAVLRSKCQLVVRRCKSLKDKLLQHKIIEDERDLADDGQLNLAKFELELFGLPGSCEAEGVSGDCEVRIKDVEERQSSTSREIGLLAQQIRANAEKERAVLGESNGNSSKGKDKENLLKFRASISYNENDNNNTNNRDKEKEKQLKQKIEQMSDYIIDVEEKYAALKKKYSTLTECIKSPSGFR